MRFPKIQKLQSKLEITFDLIRQRKIEAAANQILDIAVKALDYSRRQAGRIAMWREVMPSAGYLRQLDELIGDDRPLVTVIMPIYRTPHKVLKAAFKSLTRQSYVRWECVIVDDKSDDESLKEFVEDWCKKDDRFTSYFPTEKLGISGASNFAIQQSKGSIIAFLDHDDILLPQAIAEVVLEFKKKPDVEFVYSDSMTISGRGLPLGYMLKPGWSPEFLLSTNYIVHFCAYRTRFLQRTGLLSERPQHKDCQDVEIKTRFLSEPSSKISFLPKVLYCWRTLPTSTASSFEARPHVLSNVRTIIQESASRKGKDVEVIVPAAAKRDGAGVYQWIIKIDQQDFDRDVEVIELPAMNSFNEAWQYQKHSEILQKISRSSKKYCGFALENANFDVRSKLSELLPFFGVAENIAFVTGKAIDDVSRVIGGKVVVTPNGSARIASLNLEANEGGYWYTNLIISNCVSATAHLTLFRTDILKQNLESLGRSVQSFLLATTPTILERDMRGVSVPFVVGKYPWMRLPRHDSTDIVVGRVEGDDPYYNPNFSSQNLFEIDQTNGLPKQFEI